ncbi:MAG: hypothetical protein IPL28_04430 [Chloroflexi bacterium]|nr:hypothetical protein [Chloroflexota bacterium]
MGDAIRQGVIRASDPFGVLVVGAKGSGQQLVLSSILLQGQPVGNISYAIFEELAADERVQTAVPLAFGDNIGGARIIGTNNSFFALTGHAASHPPLCWPTAVCWNKSLRRCWEPRPPPNSV